MFNNDLIKIRQGIVSNVKRIPKSSNNSIMLNANILYIFYL